MANINKIKQLAREKGIKIKFICAQLGLSETYLSNVKNGRDHMTDERLSAIANILGTTVEYLNDETEEKCRTTDFSPNSVILYGTTDKLIEKHLNPEQIELLRKIIELFP